MNEYKLSEMYAMATQRMADAVTELYEDLHNQDGRPIFKREKISEGMAKFRKAITLEIDLVKQAALEFQGK